MTRFDCEELASKLDALVDGTLAVSEESAARDHLESCSSCAAEVEAAERLAAATRSLPAAVEPERDLWPEIKNRIDDGRVVRGSFPRNPRPTMPRLWLAAAAAAVLVLSVGVAYMVGLEHARTRVATATPHESVAVPASYDIGTTDLERVRNELRTTLEDRRRELSPETWSVVMENMAVIDDAIARIENALAENPGDGRLNRQLASAYRRQIALLRTANTLPGEA